jgi:hypothetical protein
MAGIPSIPKINRLLTSVSTSGSVAGPEAAYIADITAKGATVTAPQRAAISTFMSDAIAAGRWDGIKRFYFPVWGVAAANAVCMKSLTSGTFSGAMTHGAGFITSTGGILLTSTNLPALGITVESHHLSVLSKLGGSRDYSYAVSSSANVTLGKIDSDYKGETKSSQITAGEPIPNPTGVFSYGGTRTSRFLKRRLTAGVSTLGTSTASVSGDFSNIAVNLMRSTSGFTNYCDDHVGVLSLGTALSDAEDTTYTASLKTLWETVTGLTLP